MKRLTTVSNPIEATLLQHTLENEGIASFTTNEHTSVMLPHFYGMLGHGIQVMVRDSDYERAQEVLAQKRQEGNLRKCPNCGSLNIEFGMKGKKRWRERVLIFLSLIATIPIGNLKNKYYCNDCGSSFE